MSLLVNSARMEGFVVFDYAKQYPKGIAEMAKWMAEGKLKDKEHIVSGLENSPECVAFAVDCASSRSGVLFLCG